MIHEHFWDGGHWGLGMWLIPIIVILVVYFLIRNNPQTKGRQNSETPIEILKKRYAQGEINKDQFEQMKKDLS